jgi:hypothetical protein
MKLMVSFKKQIVIIGVIIAIVSNMMYFTSTKESRQDSRDGIDRNLHNELKEEAQSDANVLSVETKRESDSTERGLTIMIQE